MLKQPRVLVLDEATSHLDVAREKEVNSAIGALNVTRICIARRPETIAMSRRVLRMEHGAIVDDTGDDQRALSGSPHPASPRSA